MQKVTPLKIFGAYGINHLKFHFLKAKIPGSLSYLVFSAQLISN